jgi:hypothetical protein
MYTNKWNGSNSTTLTSNTNRLCFYMGMGFPGGPGMYPLGSPFGLGYTLDRSYYLDLSDPIKV